MQDPTPLDSLKACGIALHVARIDAEQALGGLKDARHTRTLQLLDAICLCIVIAEKVAFIVEADNRSAEHELRIAQ